MDSGEGMVRDDTGVGAPVELSFAEGTVLTELVDECTSIASIDAHRYLCIDDQGARYVNEAIDPALPLGMFSAVAAAVTDEQMLVSLDGTVAWFDGTELTPLDWPSPVPVETMNRLGESIWMTGAGRLFRYRAGAVSEITVSGQSSIYGHVEIEGRLYLSVPELVSIDLDGPEPNVQWVWDRSVQSLAADESDSLWFVSDEQLFVKRSGESPVAVWMPEPVHEVVGSPLWVRGVRNLFRYHNGGFTVYPLVAEGMVGVDSVGRLLQVHEGTLRRHSVGRPVVAVGLSDSVMVAETVTLLPSDPSSVDDLRVWIGDQELAVSTEPYQVVVDPEALAVGEHQLRFFTESAKGDSLSSETVWVGELNDVEWPEIEAISEQHCIRCHGGETLTDLSSAADWERHSDAIIDVVMMQEMPLGGPYLSEAEIIAIRAWKHGGFQ